jgi:DNA-binding transcriptional regulator LsrR (DeoR family)
MGRMDDKTIEMLAAALLAAEGRKAVGIAKALDISAVAVSRHLKDARVAGYLRAEVTFLRNDLSNEEMKKVQKRLTNRKLEDKLNFLGRRSGQERQLSLRVFHCGAKNDEGRQRQRLALAAAPFVRSLLSRSRSCGLTWGGMLEALVTAVRGLHFPTPWKKEPIEFIPLSGEPLGRERSSFSSSNLARDLGAVVNGETYDAPSLAMIPAFVPDAFRPYERDGVWRLIELVIDYQNIFGPHTNGSTSSRRSRGPAPKAMDLDMLLTSVGSSDHPMGFGRGILFDHLSVDYRELRALLAAEVGGVCIRKADLTLTQKRRFDTVLKSWTGLQLKHLAACAARGSDSLTGPPGVVVLSAGQKRAGAVRELIKHGLVNHLIVDEVLAEELDSITG